YELRTDRRFFPLNEKNFSAKQTVSGVEPILNVFGIRLPKKWMAGRVILRPASDCKQNEKQRHAFSCSLPKEKKGSHGLWLGISDRKRKRERKKLGISHPADAHYNLAEALKDGQKDLAG